MVSRIAGYFAAPVVAAITLECATTGLPVNDAPHVGGPAVTLYEGPEVRPPRRAVRFAPLASWTNGEVQIVNGTPIDTATFPATAPSRGTASCTATLIGPQVALTAAHCVDAALRLSDGKPMTVAATITFDRPYDLACTLTDDYMKAKPVYTLRPRMAEDWALCQLSGAPRNIRAETISLDPPVAGGRDYFLLGFGCSKIVRRPNGLLEGLDEGGRLLAGVRPLAETAIGFDGAAGGFAMARSRGAEPSLCPGDSGGGTMIGIDLGHVDRSRKVALVNSALGSTGQGAGLELYSYFAPLGTGSFERFARRWAGTGPARQICGIHLKPGQPACRG